MRVRRRFFGELVLERDYSRELTNRPTQGVVVLHLTVSFRSRTSDDNMLFIHEFK